MLSLLFLLGLLFILCFSLWLSLSTHHFVYFLLFLFFTTTLLSILLLSFPIFRLLESLLQGYFSVVFMFIYSLLSILLCLLSCFFSSLLSTTSSQKRCSLEINKPAGRANILTFQLKCKHAKEAERQNSFHN